MTLKLDPTYVDAHFNLGIAYQDKGQYSASLKCYDNTCLLDSDFIEAKKAAKSIREILKHQSKKKVAKRSDKGEKEIKQRSREKRERRQQDDKENRVNPTVDTPIKHKTSEHVNLAFEMNN